jgi:hypothetical protein
MPSSPQPISNPLAKVFRSRPLVHLKAAMLLLDQTEDGIISLLEDGTLEWAFDLKRKSSRRGYLVIAACSIDRLLTGAPEPATLDEVIQLAVPPRDFFRVVELKHRWGVSSGHLTGLIEDGFLKVQRPACYSTASPYVTGASVKAFLAGRRRIS